jgi:hypothetical protein
VFRISLRKLFLPRPQFIQRTRPGGAATDD